MLSPYTVLDLTDDRGELASMVLGDLGADVIKVEPPMGSPSRRMGPFLEDAPEPEASLHFYAFNRNKRGITLDLATQAGRSALLRLAERADFLIESARPGEMAKLGLDFATIRQANSRIVHVAITAYGQDGPHAEFAASDLTLAAMGGPMSLQGDAGRAPVRLSAATCCETLSWLTAASSNTWTTRKWETFPTPGTSSASAATIAVRAPRRPCWASITRRSYEVSWA